MRFAGSIVPAMILAACQTGGGTTPTASPAPSGTTAAPPATQSAPPAPSAAPSLATMSGDYEVAPDGRTLHMTCLGEGSPTIILEGGHPGSGLADFLLHGRRFTEKLAAERRVCAYDRAGYGSSDPAPNEPRDLDDVTDDLPKPSAKLTLDEAPQLAWDDPSNPEHVNVVPEFENRLANERFPFEAPLLVITATEGGSLLSDQAFWLDWSDASEQRAIRGGHEVYVDSPDAVRDAILDIAP
jgi:hypothetical protein